MRVLARATDFDRDHGISTRGVAEVIYVSSSGKASDLVSQENRIDDALARARQVTGCQQASHTHSQYSLLGTHMMMALSACPPLSKR